MVCHPYATGQQRLPDPWPAVATPALGMDSLDVHQEGIVAQVAALRAAGTEIKMPVVPGVKQGQGHRLARNHASSRTSLRVIY